MLNGIGIVTYQTIKLISSLLDEGLYKAAVFVDASDKMSIEFLKTKFKNQVSFVYIGLPESNYLTIIAGIRTCQNMIYLQSNFVVNSKKLLK